MFGRLVDWILLVGAIIGLMFTGWWTVYAAPNSAENLENILQVQTQSKLINAGHDWVNVAMDGQKATLTGQAPSVEAVEAVITRLGGDQLVMGPITKITSNITSAPPISPYVFVAEESGDTLTLQGYVPSAAIRREILTEAEALYPGGVSNQLKIGTGEPLGPWKEVAVTGVKLIAPLENGRFALTNSQIQISGKSETGTLDPAPFTAFLDPTDIYTLETDIRGPALWEARFEENTLTLAGRVASQARRSNLVALAKENFDGPVLDQMQIAAGTVDDWSETAGSLLPGLADFQSGKLVFAPEENGFLVEGVASGSVQTYLEQDLVSGPYPVLFRVETLEVELAELGAIDFSGDLNAACQAGFDNVMAANTLTFETGRATISRISGLTLDKLVAVTQKCGDLIIEVRGHTDSIGNRDSNIALSKTRAMAVIDYMTRRGIAPERLEAVGFGPDVPVGDNATPSGRAANRRIEFKTIEGG